MTESLHLERFVAAQDGTYEQALSELRRGRKGGHWMWFVFPQIAGLGRSSTARAFAIASLAEARAYLVHPVLGPRLIDCAATVAAIHDRTAEEILGAIDAVKLRSSMTLFLRADPGQPVWAQVLDRYYDGVADERTDQLLGTSG